MLGVYGVAILETLLKPLVKLAAVYGPWAINQSEGAADLFRRGQQSSAGIHVDEESALSLSAVFAAVNLMASITGSIPLNTHRQVGTRRELATNHPAYYLLHTQPNPEMTAATFKRTREFHRRLWGRTYAEISWLGNGKPWALWVIEPWRVQEKREDDGSLYYLVDGVRKVAPADMLVNHLISFDGIVGRSFVEFAVESLGLGLAAQEFSARFFGNGSNHGGILTHDGMPAEELRNNVRKSWQEHDGPKTAHKTKVLFGGWKWQPNTGGVDPDKAQLMEARRFTNEEVARFQNIPPHLLRDLTHATFSNIEHQGIDFVVYSMTPPLVEYEQEYDRKLLAPPDLYCKHNVTALLRGDNASRSAFYREQFNIGAMNLNEIRELEERNPIEGGDTYFVPLNMQPLAEAVKPKEEPKPEPAPVVEEEDQDEPETPDESATEDEEEEDKEEDNGQMAARLGLLTHTLARLAKVEANEIRRAAKQPSKLLSWMDEFYPRFEAMLSEALTPVLAMWDTAPKAAAVAATWCQRSQQGLLVAAEVKADQLQMSIEMMLAGWSVRPAEYATELLGEQGAADMKPDKLAQSFDRLADAIANRQVVISVQPSPVAPPMINVQPSPVSVEAAVINVQPAPVTVAPPVINVQPAAAPVEVKVEKVAAPAAPDQRLIRTIFHRDNADEITHTTQEFQE